VATGIINGGPGMAAATPIGSLIGSLCLGDMPDGHVISLQSWCRLVHPAAPRQGQCYQQPQKHRDDDLLHDTPPICESLRVGALLRYSPTLALRLQDHYETVKPTTPLRWLEEPGSAQATDDDSVKTVIGAPGRIRTCDLKIRSLLLYPAELRALDVATSRRDETRSGTLGRHSEWSGRRGSNPRPSAWKADALAN
jgi:hypothetical protein